MSVISKKFNLIKSFAISSLIVILITSAVSAVLLSNYIRDHLLERDATVSMEFVQSLSSVHDPLGYFTEGIKLSNELKTFFGQISRLPDVLRVNIYSHRGDVIWSSNKDIVGTAYVSNHELDEALNGELVIEVLDANEVDKAEHMSLWIDTDIFLEYYLPIRDSLGQQVVGVAEIYKKPTALLNTLTSGRTLVWGIALVSALVLYITLYWIVRHGNHLIQQQQQALIDSERMATIGNMVASVAHSIRNPIASVRSSAELGVEESKDQVKSYFQDIINEVDRFDEWVRELLTFSKREIVVDQKIDALDELILSSIRSFGERPARQNVRISERIDERLPAVRGDAQLMQKVINSVISNSLEAMPKGGELEITASQIRSCVQIVIKDSGVGLATELTEKAFIPMVSSKPNGLGVGLALARRIVEGYGGSIELRSQQSMGTTALLSLPVVTQ